MAAVRKLGPNIFLAVAAVVACAALASWGLGEHLFWDDEANTALFAQNLLKYGELTAWDGNNLVGFRAGAELDEDLRNTYMPPLQYYVAALGFAAAGPGTVAGRVPFVVAGLLALVFTALWVRGLTKELPWALPLFLLAVSPAYLLYIRNCRYYALSILFVNAAVFAVFAPPGSRPRSWGTSLLAFTCGGAAFASHYLSAASLLVALPVLLLTNHLRPGIFARRWLACAAGVGAAGAWMLLTRGNPFEAGVVEPDGHPWISRFATLALRHLRDLGTFEFAAVALWPALALPLFVPSLKAFKKTARTGLALIAFCAVFSLATAAVSPQPLDTADVADMRHVVALMPAAAAVTAIAVFLLWRAARGAGAVALVAVVFTNLPHFGFAAPRSERLPNVGVRCTLCEYVMEPLRARTTSTEALVEYLGALPQGEVVFIYPTFMSYAPMFYLPKLRYACQLTRDKRLRPDLADALPSYLFWEDAQIDVAVVHGPPPRTLSGPLKIKYRGTEYQLGRYEIIDSIDVFPEDRSRPEIPWHTFDPSSLESVDYSGYLVARISR